MRTSVIVAMGKNHVIGDDRGLPWHLPKDLRRFRQLTLGKAVLMGRKTLELIGSPLAGRENIVLTRNRSFADPACHIAHDVEAALSMANWLARQGRASRPEAGERAEGELMVIGGGEVYRQLLPSADRVYLTVVGGVFTGSATFPFDELLRMAWDVRAEEHVPADGKNAFPHAFYVLERVRDAVEGSACLIEPGRLLAG